MQQPDPSQKIQSTPSQSFPIVPLTSSEQMLAVVQVQRAAWGMDDLTTHMAGVMPEYQSHDIGFALYQAQAHCAKNNQIRFNRYELLGAKNQEIRLNKALRHPKNSLIAPGGAAAPS
jgi:hypothetical protein